MNRRILLGLALAAAISGSALAQDKSIIVASTTSTQDSGLFGHILPAFKAKTGIDVKVISQGTGQALDTGRRGDADVVFVHARPQEEKFVADGFGVKRYAVMYNDFILVGPKSDPAGVASHHFENHDAFMTGRGGMEPVERVHDRRDGGIETERHCRRLEVVVDCLGNADAIDAGVLELLRCRHRAVAPDDDEPVDAQ